MMKASVLIIYSDTAPPLSLWKFIIVPNNRWRLIDMIIIVGGAEPPEKRITFLSLLLAI